MGRVPVQAREWYRCVNCDSMDWRIELILEEDGEKLERMICNDCSSTIRESPGAQDSGRPSSDRHPMPVRKSGRHS